MIVIIISFHGKEGKVGDIPFQSKENSLFDIKKAL